MLAAAVKYTSATRLQIGRGIAASQINISLNSTTATAVECRASARSQVGGRIAALKGNPKSESKLKWTAVNLCTTAGTQVEGRGGKGEGSRMSSRLTKHGKVFILELLGTGDHRLTPALCSEMLSHLEMVNNSEDAGALVTTSEGKFFCNGLDLEWINSGSAGEERGPALYKQFEELLVTLMSLKVPTIAAICGHAAAGGLAIAMAHDHRFMRADRGFLYSGGVDVRVSVPSGTLALLACKMTPRAYKDAVLKCVKFTGKMALEEQLIDTLCDDSVATFEEALKEAESLAGRNWDKAVYQEMRLAMYPHVVEKLQAGEYQSFAPVGASLKGFR